jgi:hypothetical protein
MQMAHSAAPVAHPGDLEVRQVLRDGILVAVLMAIDHGDTFTVVAEVFGKGDNGDASVSRRPYNFPDSDSAHAFITEAITSFMYLGCEIRQL